MALIAAIDPGETHCGLAVLSLITDEPGGHQCDCLDCSQDGTIRVVWCQEYSQEGLAEWLEHNLRRLHAVVAERFQLYPWMARQQGFSEFRTAECIGVVRYLCRIRDIPLELQDAAGCKKDGRAYASKLGFEMATRKLGSGKYAYWGPDFARFSGPAHRRDALAHGVYWSVRARRSPVRRTM